MHEYSIVGALIERVEAEALARQASVVRRVWVKVGDLSGVDRELLMTAYETFRERTLCENAPLALSRVPVEWACSRCRAPIAPGAPLACPSCGGRATLVAGDEIVLERIEMEAPDV